MDAPSKMTTRTVLRSNGRAYRVLLSQPPSYRRGADPVPAIDDVTRAVARDAVRAITNAQFEAREKGAALARR